ncbi:hypothetical protein SAMN03080617_01853 [Algoriphagus alkaliphilus]|uniref:Antitoxin of type II TA system, VapB n=1 Tax=Algoriphagus alkaliphilus TaxID=279824 RepID=A0A1G5XMN2_9BACT|nr:DUF2191 domain-containing protein [Algoriphagus alkaliphilus]SDA71194.1 hypothetical protein SAMN03080617_01853 [Algoriphagus alkaliphilus]
MKITALIPEEMIKEAMELSRAATITDALKTALAQYIAIEKIKRASESLVSEPLEFYYTAEQLRSKNQS